MRMDGTLSAGRLKCLGFALVCALFWALAPSTPSAIAAGCNQVASPGASISTPQQLVNALQPGQVGCFHAGTYSNTEVDITKSGITLQSYPGERATWDGRVVIATGSVTLQSLNLDGTTGTPCTNYSGCTLPSPSINGPNARIYGDDITNRGGICINTSAYYKGLSPDSFDIERNRIHGCMPSDNHNHGIYIADGANGVIKYNVIYNNGDRGIQLYPNAQGETISYNTLDGNRTNLIFSGDCPPQTSSCTSSSNNVVTNNIFSFPSTSVADSTQGLGARFNVEHYWGDGAPPGAGNQLGTKSAGNCFYTNATGYFGGTPASSGIASAVGFSVGPFSPNIVGDPEYVNRAGHDFTLASGSPCAGMGAPPDVTAPSSSCDQVASPNGAISTPQQLVDALRPGQVGCFQAGMYSNQEVDITKPSITLQSYPGQRATWDGSIVVEAAGVTIQNLILDGSAGTGSAVMLNGPNSTVSGSNMTNANGVCVYVASSGNVIPTEALVDSNRIHNCSYYGVNVRQGDNAVISNNVIYDVAGSGVVLYPAPTDAIVESNTVDGGSTGLEFSGDSSGATSNAVATNNIISFPVSRFNVEAYWGGSVGTGNQLIGNCTYTTMTGYFGGSPPGSGISTDQGFSASGNIVGNPGYSNRAGKDFTLQSGSACAGKGAPAAVAKP